MVRRTTLIIVLLCLSLTRFGVEGKKSSEKKKQAEVKTVRTKHGDEYECTEFHKQSTFNHPAFTEASLKNHASHVERIKPVAFPKERKNIGNENKFVSAKIGKHLWENGKGCPYGTVPIRKRNDKTTGLYETKSSSSWDGNLYHAELQTKGEGVYYGGGMISSVFNPKVEGYAFTATRLQLSNGPDSIEVGWTVNPLLYGDNRTRLYIHTDTEKSSCYNTYCPGYVHVRSDIPIDTILEHVSTRGKDSVTYKVDFFIYKDAANGNWYLVLGPDNTIVGFWPQSIFTALSDSAKSVKWGGKVFSLANVPTPPMGAGNSRLFEDSRQDAICYWLTVINQDHKVVDATNTRTYTDSEIYKIKDEGYVNNNYRHLFFYGGVPVKDDGGDEGDCKKGNCN